MHDHVKHAPMPGGWHDHSPAAGGDAGAAALRGSVRCALDDRGYLEVTGADAAAHLHGQLSSDITQLAPGDVRLSAYSDPKGRVLAVTRVIADAGRFLLELPAERLEPIRAQLTKYALRADVRVRDASETVARFGVAGENAAVALAGVAGPLPEVLGTSRQAPGGARVFRVEGPRPRWTALGPADAIASLWSALDAHAVTADASAWRLLEIEAGMPIVEDEMVGRYVAQMLNLDRLAAIDFRKGCYPGQEVIARARYLGRVKRRTYVLRTTGADAPQRGAAVLREDGSPVGEILYAAPHPDGGALALAVLQTGAAGQSLRLTDAHGPAAEARTPPYALEEAA